MIHLKDMSIDKSSLLISNIDLHCEPSRNVENVKVNCVDVERKCYLFYQPNIRGDWSRNKLIGEIIEQENDAGENMFLFKLYFDKWDVIDWLYIDIPGINTKLCLDIYVRSGGLPYFLECRIPPKNTCYLVETYNILQMDYYDPFEMVMRSRGISHHDFCYIGRTPTDFFDRHYYMDIAPLQLKEQLPNLPCGNPENDFHSIK